MFFNIWCQIVFNYKMSTSKNSMKNQYNCIWAFRSFLLVGCLHFWQLLCIAPSHCRFKGFTYYSFIYLMTFVRNRRRIEKKEKWVTIELQRTIWEKGWDFKIKSNGSSSSVSSISMGMDTNFSIVYFNIHIMLLKCIVIITAYFEVFGIGNTAHT